MFFAENILYATVEEKKFLSWSDIVVCQYDSLPKLGYWKVQKCSWAQASVAVKEKVYGVP